jgi:hypothetical protein
MSQRVDVPGLGLVEFPDGMSDADMATAIKRTLSAPKQPTAADETGPFEAALIAAGKSTARIGQGVQQLYYGAKSKFETPTLNDAVLGSTPSQRKLADLKQEVDEEDRLYAPLKQAHPIATGIGEAAPAMAVPVGAASGLGFIARSAAANALPELLSYGSAEDRLKRGAVGATGGAAGGAIGLGAARFLRPAGATGTALSPEAQAAADRLGYKLTPGQTTQNAAIQGFENYLARSPGSSGTMQARGLANQTALNRAAASAMGQSADDLGERTFAAAKKAIRSKFDRLEQATSPQLGNDFFDALTQIDSANAARISFKSEPIDSLVNKGLDLAAQGNLTGTAYKEIRSTISSDAKSAFRSENSILGQALTTVRDALDRAAEQSLSPADQEAWKMARAQWAAYKALSKGNVSEGGNVSAARLASMLRQQGDALRTGAMQGPLSDVARLGEALKGVANPTSGQLAQQMAYGNPITGIPLTAMNWLTAKTYTSKPMQKYLAEGLVKIGPDGKLVLGKAAGVLGNQQAKAFLGAE